MMKKILITTILSLGFGLVAQAENITPSGTTPTPRTIEYSWMPVATWQRMHAEDVLVADHDQVDLLFVGDSITAGWDWQIWQNNFAPLKAANFGIGGDHTGNILWRLQHGDVGQIHPKVIVLLAGVNNFGILNETPAQVFAGVSAVVKQLQLAFPQAKILLNAVFPFEQSAQSPKRLEVKKLNKMLAKLGDDKRVFFRDYGHLFVQKNGDISSEILGDYLHPTAKGYAIWAAAMTPEIKQLLGTH